MALLEFLTLPLSKLFIVDPFANRKKIMSEGFRWFAEYTKAFERGCQQLVHTSFEITFHNRSFSINRSFCCESKPFDAFQKFVDCIKGRFDNVVNENLLELVKIFHKTFRKAFKFISFMSKL